MSDITDRHKSQNSLPNLSKIDHIIVDIQRKLSDTIEPLDIRDLSAFERKQIHSFFDDKPDYKTKTYRDNDTYVFRIYPVGNLKRFAEQKAKEASEKGQTIPLPPMPSFERFVIHEHLKSWDGIETTSFDENENRHIEIKPKRFGRTLKKIIKKIKLF
jgi:predicted RNA-binding protein Jag